MMTAPAKSTCHVCLCITLSIIPGAARIVSKLYVFHPILPVDAGEINSDLPEKTPSEPRARLKLGASQGSPRQEATLAFQRGRTAGRSNTPRRE